MILLLGELLKLVSFVDSANKLFALIIIVYFLTLCGFFYIWKKITDNKTKKSLEQKDKQIEELTQQLEWARNSADKALTDNKLLEERCYKANEIIHDFNNRLITAIETQILLNYSKNLCQRDEKDI